MYKSDVVMGLNEFKKLSEEKRVNIKRPYYILSNYEALLNFAISAIEFCAYEKGYSKVDGNTQIDLLIDYIQKAI